MSESVDSTGGPPRLLGEQWQNRWNQFRDEHAAWWERVGKSEPVYSLPKAIIKALSKPRAAGRSRRVVISSNDAKAEQAFLEVCKLNFMPLIGIWSERPLVCSPMEWERSEIQQVARMQHQMVGFMGWLTFNSSYRQELILLNQMWRALPQKLQFPQGLSGPLSSLWERGSGLIENGMDALDSHPGGFQYNNAMREFSAKWQLSGLLTWEIPLPRYPLVWGQAGELSKLYTPDTYVMTLPLFYDLPSVEDIRAGIREAQQRAATASGFSTEFPITNISPRNGNPSIYERAFRFWLIERSVRHRYGEPHGLVEHLIGAFCEYTETSDNYVKLVRKKYVQFLKD